MQERLEQIRHQTLQDIALAEDSAALEQVRVRSLGKKGSLTEVLRAMGTLSAEKRPAIGALANQVRQALESALEDRSQEIHTREKQAALLEEAVDVTLPAPQKRIGSLHLLTQVQRRIEDIFTGMGFTIEHGPEIEYDRYNFELLNVPKGHAARDMQDTFYITPEILLRSHTSPVQARTMLKTSPPIRIICPGRVYRADPADASHSPVFHQVEGLLVDEGVTMSHLRGVLDIFCKQFFGSQTQTRFRSSYFPFTEPSAEVDVSCTICNRKGCQTCKYTGWLELLGCGMVHPNVLNGCGIDASTYSGFAFGMGIDRLALLKYGISDMRLLFENDLRFLSQF